MLIAGNWKMNNGPNELDIFLKTLNTFNLSEKVEMCIMPPFPLILEAKKKIFNSHSKRFQQDINCQK